MPVTRVFQNTILFSTIIVLLLVSGCISETSNPNNSANSKTKILVIGEPSTKTKEMLTSMQNIVVNFSAEDNLLSDLNSYKIVMLDQTGQSVNAIPRKIAKPLQDYVKGGGNFVVVMDSGLWQSDGKGGYYTDATAWGDSVLGKEIKPSDCFQMVPDPTLDCASKTTTTGNLKWLGQPSPIFPSFKDNTPITLTLTKAQGHGTIIYFEEDGTGKKYNAISIFSVNTGKVILINYEPSVTPNLFNDLVEHI